MAIAVDAAAKGSGLSATLLHSAMTLKEDVTALKRQRILEEASRLFFEKGYTTSTLDMLATRLEVTKPFIYSYFKSKHELLAVICEMGITESLAVLDAVQRHRGDPLTELRAVIAGVAETVIRLQNYVVIYQREMKELERRDAQRILQLRHHFDQQMVLLLKRGVESGVFDIADPAMSSVWIGGLLSWIPLWYVPGGRREAREIVDHAVDSVMRLVGADTAVPRS
jgi:AcrR family transcriptional regulator